jgi:hypothetical protein
LISGEIVLPQVAVNAGERLDVRVYDPLPTGDLTAHIEVSDASSGEILATRSIRTFWSPSFDPQPGIQNVPGVAAVSDIRPELLNDFVGVVNIRISVPEGKLFWAYANATDNVTQQITLYTPQ